VCLPPGDPMRVLGGWTLALAAVACGCTTRDPGAGSLACTLRAEPTFPVGQQPRLIVELRNLCQRDIYLVRCLYASNALQRCPHCSFHVTGPPPPSELKPIDWCGVLDPLRPEELTRVLPGGTFDPYQGGPAWGQEVVPERFVAGLTYRI